MSKVQYAETIVWGLWLGYRIRAYGQGLGPSFGFSGSVFRVRV